MLNALMKKLEKIGSFFVFIGQVFLSIFRPPFRLNQFLNEVELLGVNSVLIIMLSSAAIGMIFALQMVSLLETFQAEIAVGAAVAVSMARELAPIITSLMLIAKSGSAMTAELGTMNVTEQIDALESMAINPIQYLILPKVLACLLVFPVLTLLANIVGTVGSYLVSVYLFSIDNAGYIDYMFDFLYPIDIIMGMIKAAIMGVMVSVICCYFGLNTTQGAKGVGDSATKAVVASSVSILVADYVLTTLMMPLIAK
ncbi:MlaE family ABC transporter permease [Breznakiellaceae bacterium SP9]